MLVSRIALITVLNVICLISYSQCPTSYSIDVEAGTGVQTTLDLVAFNPSCGCGSFSDCVEVTVNFFETTDPGVNYGCDVLVVRASNGLLGNDYFDIIDPTTCTQFPESQSFYAIFSAQPQYSKTYLICQGDDTGWTELTFDSESATCSPEPLCESDTVDPDVSVESGDLYLEEMCRGVVLKNALGDCYRIIVDNLGQVISESVDCP